MMVLWWFNISLTLLGEKLGFLSIILFLFFLFLPFISSYFFSKVMLRAQETAWRWESSQRASWASLPHNLPCNRYLWSSREWHPGSKGGQIPMVSNCEYSQATTLQGQKGRGEKGKGTHLKLHYRTQLKIPLATGCLGWIWPFLWNHKYFESTFFSFSGGIKFQAGLQSLLHHEPVLKLKPSTPATAYCTQRHRCLAAVI